MNQTPKMEIKGTEPEMEAASPDKSRVADWAGQHYSRLRNFIRGKVKTDEDAEDIVQEVFYKLSKADDLVSPVDQVVGWLYTVARNQITDWWRKRENSTPTESLDNPDRESEFKLTGSDPSPEDEYMRGEIWENIESALEELPADQKEIFELTEIYGLTFQEISESSGININTLLSRKRYATNYLREKLSHIYDTLDE